jgi:molybdopterin-guanine dinucleotide biosynthesis protein A
LTAPTESRVPIPARPLAGLVLCGGASTRMGRDKALIEVDGVPLAAAVASRLRRAADPVFLASGEPGRLRHLGHPEVADDPGGIGPLGGLLGGLAVSPHLLMAVVGVDMPFVSPQLMTLLARLHREEDAVVPVTRSGVEPLHAVYATTAVDGLRRTRAEGRVALRAALDTLRVRLVAEDEWKAADPTGKFALNLNRPEDLKGLV